MILQILKSGWTLLAGLHQCPRKSLKPTLSLEFSKNVTYTVTLKFTSSSDSENNQALLFTWIELEKLRASLHSNYLGQ